MAVNPIRSDEDRQRCPSGEVAGDEWVRAFLPIRHVLWDLQDSGRVRRDGQCWKKRGNCGRLAYIGGIAGLGDGDRMGSVGLNNVVESRNLEPQDGVEGESSLWK